MDIKMILTVQQMLVWTPFFYIYELIILLKVSADMLLTTADIGL